MSTETWWILGACGALMLLAVVVEIVWRLYADRGEEPLDDGIDAAVGLATTTATDE